MLRIQLKRLTAENDEVRVSLVQAERYAENVAVVERERAQVEKSDMDMAIQMWQKQAEEAMIVAETSTKRAQGLAKEVEIVQVQRDECLSAHEQLQNELNSVKAAEERATAALSQAKRELRCARDEAARGQAAAKAAYDERFTSENRRIAQLNEARSAIDRANIDEF